MNEIDAYFTETMPDDERLTNYRAFTRGSITALSFFLERVKSYCDLLEVELLENPVAETYLNENFAALARASSVLDHLQELTQQQLSDEYEPFDLVLLFHGIIDRLERIGLAHISLPDKKADVTEAFIRGRFFMIQQALFEIPHFFSADTPVALTCRIEAQDISQEFFKNRKAVLSGGEYYQVTLSLDSKAAESENLICYTEKLVSAPTLALNEEVLFVYGIILEHGGELLVNRDGEKIHTLQMLLPTVHNQAEMFTETGVDEEDLQGNETILLVDDEGIIWDVVIDMLQGLGYTVLLAEHGRDCVEIYRENPGEIDLILLDMVMPEMNGREAFFALKKIDPDVKVLLQSGYIAQEDAQDVLDAGALGFLKKPYRMTELAKEVRRILDKR